MTLSSGHVPEQITDCIRLAHPSWHTAILNGLQAMHAADATYFSQLCSAEFLPTEGRLFAAFQQPLTDVRYVLIGEGPYPRAASATGVCFMDGAVDSLWAEDGSGLSKKVNRATSLRNFIKMLLVASGDLDEAHTSGDAMAVVAAAALNDEKMFIRKLADLQENMHRQGFLLLNATLVFRDSVAPVKDGKSWQPFLQAIFSSLSAQNTSASPPSLVLWGKIAEQLKRIPEAAHFPHILAEHPYNLSFITNREMQDFFRPMQLLRSCLKENFCKKHALVVA